MIHLISKKKLLFDHPNIIHYYNENEISPLLFSLIDNFKYVSVDTETEGFFDFKNKTIMLQLGVKDHQFIFDVRDFTPNVAIEVLNTIDVKKILWNAKFDYKFIKNDFNIELENVYDGFIAQLCIQCGLPKLLQKLSLADASLHYLNEKLNKEVRNKFVRLNGSPFTLNQILYGAKDVEVLYPIMLKQEKHIEKYNLYNIVELENQAALALADMEYNGLPFNAKKWDSLADISINKHDAAIKILDDYILSQPKTYSRFITGAMSLFDDINVRKLTIDWTSPAQVLKVFNIAGIECESVGALEIGKYKADNELAKLYSNYKPLSKLVTSFGKDFLKYVNPITNKVHTNYWPILNTHRVSSAEPNIQQIPAKKEYLACFEAENGWAIVSSDYSGQELRIIAEGSKEPSWIKAFNEGADLHGTVASSVFDIPIDEVREPTERFRGKSYRDAAKGVNFLLAFGGTEYKLSETLTISLDMAKDIINTYFSKTERLKPFFDRCNDYAVENKYIRSFKPYSAIRWLLPSVLDAGEIKRRAYNTPIQTTGACMIKLALIKIRRYIKENNLQNKVYLIHSVHDAILSKTLIEYAEEWATIQEKLMIEAGKEFISSIPIVVDTTINTYWQK